MPDITRSNKGTYSWPKTIRGRTVNLPCQFDGGPGIFASYTCSKFGGKWEGLNISYCPFVSEATRLLEQFTKLNLTLVPPLGVVDSAKRLSNYTETNIFLGQLMDPVDVAFLTRTIEIYLEFVSHDTDELGTILLDIVSHIMRMNRAVLQRAQVLNQTSARLISAVEKIAYASPVLEPPRSHAIRLYRTSSERFSGIICTSLRSKTNFDCVLPTNYNYLPFNEKTIEMSIQLPASIAVHPASALQNNLLVTAYMNNNLFPHNQTNYLITSAVIGFSFKGILTLNDPVHVMLKPKPYHNEKSIPRPVVWDPELGVWTNQGCTTVKASASLVVFSCTRFGYYGLLQNVNYLNDFDNEKAGQKFRLSPPGFYIGGIVLFFCCWINITTYAVAGRQILMPRRIKHSLINTWLAISMLVFVFSVGIYQTENFDMCQIFGFVLHYLCLAVLLWMCVTFSQLHKRISVRRSTVGDDDRRSRQRKPISGLYFVGWGVGGLICILSGAINVEEYATYHYCFLKPAPAVSALFVPALILFLVIFITIFRIKFTIRTREISARIAEATQMTENMDLDAIEPNTTINRSISSCTRTTHVDDQEHSLRAQVKSHVVVLLLILATWTSAAIAVAAPFSEYILYEEEIFSAIYAISATVLGLFIVFFFGMSRSDVRLIWSTINCGYKNYRGYSCRPANIINYKEYQEGAANAATSQTAPTVVYQANISRSNSQSSKNHPITFSNGTMKEKEKSFAFLNRQQFIQNSVTGTLISEPNNSEHMFYNPTQLHVARKFFRKQKRLQKQNNIDVQERRIPYDDTSSEISSMYGHHPPDRMSMAMLASGSKVNNTNIAMNPNLSYDKQFNHPYSCQSLSESDNELFMNVCHDGLQLGIGKNKVNNSTSQETMKADDKYKRTALVDIQEEEERLAAAANQKRAESPQYVNSPRRTENPPPRSQQSPPSNQPETYFELELPTSKDDGLILTLNSPVSASMNTVGLPCYQRSSSPSLKSSTDSLNTVRSPVRLTKGEAYVSAVLEITDQVTVKDGSIRVLEDSQPGGKTRSLNQLTMSNFSSGARSLLNQDGDCVRSCTNLLEGNEILQENHIPHSPVTSTQTTGHVSTTPTHNQATPTFQSPVHSQSPPNFPPPPPENELDERSNTSSPQLVSPSLCDIDDLTPTAPNEPPFLNDNQIKRRPIIIQDDDVSASEFFESPVVARETTRNISPTGISELLYQNSELSIQSQEFYAPPDNDLNIILAKNLDFEISEDEEDDDDEDVAAANCSKDYLIDGSDPLNDSGSIDELYQQIKRNANWRRKNEDYVNENSSNGSGGSSQCLSRFNNCNTEPLDVINDN